MAYVILFSQPADPYSPAVHFLRKGNPLELNTNREGTGAECAPCADSNLTLREIMSMDEMVLVEENEDNSPSSDVEEAVA
jgi:hypothetical protein